MNIAILLFVSICAIIAICDFIGWLREQRVARNLDDDER